MKIGYHASHEQFAPSALRDLAVAAQAAGFQAIKCSDHFQPWSARQGQSGHAWAWLGAAMQARGIAAQVERKCTSDGLHRPAIEAKGL